MSRLAKKPLTIPAGVTVTEKDSVLSIKGPKGELAVRVPKTLEVSIVPEGMNVKMLENSKQARADAGTVWALTRNSVKGVTDGYGKILEIEGVGYRAAMEGDTLVLSLGYVNPVKMKAPKGLAVAVEKNMIKINGIDKELVGQFAAQVRAEKKPEPYKGKGIRYQGEVIRRKVGKKAATASG